MTLTTVLDKGQANPFFFLTDSVRPCQPMSDTQKSSTSSASSKKQENSVPAAASLRPLAPKPSAPPSRPQSLAVRTTTPLASTPTVAVRRSPAPCAVCYRVGCQLPTHSAFSSRSRSSSENSPDKSTSASPRRDLSFTSSYAYRLAQQYADPGVATSKVDPVYNLPLVAELNTPQMHRLFHSFFADSQNGLRIPRPPELAGNLICSPFILPAMQDPLLCLSILAAATAVQPRQPGQQPQDVTSLTLFGQAIQEMRERLNADPTNVSDTTIVAAVFLWVVNIFLEDAAAMKYHSGSIYAFVDARGGLDKLGMEGAVARFIRWVDIVNSFVLLVPCHYVYPSDPGPSPKTSTFRYGSYWKHTTMAADMNINADVITVCQETCRLLERVEQAENAGISGSEYFQMTERLYAHFTKGSVLRARSHGRQNIDECINLAVALIQFHCFVGLGKISLVARTNIPQLVAAIKGTGGPPFWQKDLDLLVWLLFVVVMIPVDIEEKAWCLPFLCRVLTARYGHQGALKPSWKQELQNSLRQFVWCDLRLNDIFSKTCQTITDSLAKDDDDESTSDEDD